MNKTELLGTKRFVEIHVLKNYAPSNLNRDINGTPKSCMFAGVERGRISSQCIKRNIRFSEGLSHVLGSDTTGIRTRQIHGEIMTLLGSTYINSSKAVEDLLKKSKLSEVVTLYSNYDIVYMADIIKDAIDNNRLDKLDIVKELKKDADKRGISLDLAMFGRMSANQAFSNIEGAIQVAHAISTNQVNIESDFFTAVDDIVAKTKGEQGSGHLSDFEFNSNCYYFYSNIDMESLIHNLENNDNVNKDTLKEFLKGYLKEFAYVNPSGKQNSFSSQVFPSMIYVDVKEVKQGIQFTNSFSKPIKANANFDLIENSRNAFIKFVDAEKKRFNIKSEDFWLKFDDNKPVDSTEFDDLDSMLEAIINYVFV